jgi:hypothetical protein
MYLSLDDVDPAALRHTVGRRVELVFAGINP